MFHVHSATHEISPSALGFVRSAMFVLLLFILLLKSTSRVLGSPPWRFSPARTTQFLGDSPCLFLSICSVFFSSPPARPKSWLSQSASRSSSEVFIWSVCRTRMFTHLAVVWSLWLGSFFIAVCLPRVLLHIHISSLFLDLNGTKGRHCVLCRAPYFVLLFVP